MISKKYHRNDGKDECGICYDTYSKTIKCDKCRFNVCGDCWLQLLNIGTCLITKKVDYSDPLFGFNIICPQCRTIEKQHITHDYIQKIKMSYPQLINKIVRFNSPVEDFYMEMSDTEETDRSVVNTEPDTDQEYYSSDDEEINDFINGIVNPTEYDRVIVAPSTADRETNIEQSIDRFRRNTNEDVARLIRINNLFREDNRRLKNQVLHLRTMIPSQTGRT